MIITEEGITCAADMTKYQELSIKKCIS